ncbi:hypothetical protein DFH08DRAFT_813224 [Mycena albidolilacea]|uniref:Uncharacterized protein n=1 Tax=Mycena albidolilacea TaxID=1033008 RepID=A0AAD6ZSC1_9AGAR|nr:hypothetical protein DFH08DRAFT_813224 [Mycena albidolilacea]
MAYLTNLVQRKRSVPSSRPSTRAWEIIRMWRDAHCSVSDSSVDMAYLLRVIFYRWSYLDNEPLPFDVVAGFMRVGQKYAIKPFFDKALARLATAFSSSLDAYTSSVMKNSLLSTDRIKTQRAEIVVDAIILARELNLCSLLPTAFWFACVTPEPLMHKNTGSIADVDRDAIPGAMKPLRVAPANYLFGWLDETVVPALDCKGPSCHDAKLQYSLQLWRPPGSNILLSWPSSAAKGLCKSCIALGKKHHGEGAKRLWKELPLFFNLPPWEELVPPSCAKQ